MSRYIRGMKVNAMRQVGVRDKPPSHNAAMVSYFDGARTRAGYRGSIQPDLAAWAQMIGRVTSRFDLPDYPQAEQRAALAAFAGEHGRPADPLSTADGDAVADLLVTIGGWER